MTARRRPATCGQPQPEGRFRGSWESTGWRLLLHALRKRVCGERLALLTGLTGDEVIAGRGGREASSAITREPSQDVLKDATNPELGAACPVRILQVDGAANHGASALNRKSGFPFFLKRIGDRLFLRRHEPLRTRIIPSTRIDQRDGGEPRGIETWELVGLRRIE